MKKYSSIWLLFVLVLVVGFGNCKKPHKKKSKNGGSNDTAASYIQLRAYDNTFYMNATGECSGGGWATDSIPADCICIRGVWALSTNYCDEDTVIYTGDGHCFQLDSKNQRVRKIFNLDADKKNPFKSVNYLVSSSGNDFVTLKTTYRRSAHEDFGYMIRINPKHPMLEKRYDPVVDKFYDIQCTPALRKSAFSDKNHYVFISDVTGKSAFSTGSPGWCDKEMASQYWTLTVGQSFRLSDHQIQDGKMGKPESCPSTRPMSSTTKKKRDNIYFFGDRKKYEESRKKSKNGKASMSGPTKDVESIDYKEPEFLARTRVAGADYNFNYDLRWPIEANDEDQSSQLEVQTARLGSYYKDFRLDSAKGPQVQTVQEIDFLQLARKFLLTRCLSPAIKVKDINNLFRWFRWLWRESLEVYPYQEVSDVETHTRILEKLNMCYNAANYSMNLTYLCEPPARPLYPFKVETLQGGTNDTIVGIYNLVENNYTEIQGAAVFEPSIELSWKMLMILSYSCAEYFSDNPADHSALNVRIESIFNPLLRKRWITPGNSIKLMEILFRPFDLLPIINAVDSCLVSSVTHSSYNVPLSRPINESPLIYRGVEKSTKKPTTTSTTTKAPAPAPEGKRRKKRSFVKPPTLWEMGYCIRDPADPYMKYNARGRCLKNF